MQHSNTAGCILLKFYIKPQHTANVYNLLYVVSYRNSTSNHNPWRLRSCRPYVVSYRNSTSNHNLRSDLPTIILLYLIEILHQTTTFAFDTSPVQGCILSKFYIKPQQAGGKSLKERGCILSKFYIKPQLDESSAKDYLGCILSKFYIKPQPSARVRELLKGCILSKFYIKPQRCRL